MAVDTKTNIGVVLDKLQTRGWIWHGDELDPGSNPAVIQSGDYTEYHTVLRKHSLWAYIAFDRTEATRITIGNNDGQDLIILPDPDIRTVEMVLSSLEAEFRAGWHG